MTLLTILQRHWEQEAAEAVCILHCPPPPPTDTCKACAYNIFGAVVVFVPSFFADKMAQSTIFLILVCIVNEYGVAAGSEPQLKAVVKITAFWESQQTKYLSTGHLGLMALCTVCVHKVV